MYTIEVETGFFGFHQVAKPDGEMEPLHSHNWQVKVQVGSEELNEWGMVMDFADDQRPYLRPCVKRAKRVLTLGDIVDLAVAGYKAPE